MKNIKLFATLSLVLVFMLSCASPAMAAGKALPSGMSRDEIGSEIEGFAAEHESTTAGMAVCVFDKGGDIYQNYFGMADIENNTAVDSDTVFEWGSASKLLVWVSVMQLWEQGKLKLEADVREYLPEGFLTNLNFEKPITMLDLMNHTAGFQELLNDLMLRNAEDVHELGEQLKLHEPEQIYEPGSVTAYSNWGVALAGYIVERVSGKPYYEYIHENIFEPLGMEHTAINFDLSDNDWVKEQREKLQCYTSEGKLIPNSFYYISLYPAGMCTGTLADFTAFAKAVVPGAGKVQLFQKESTLEKLLSPTSFYGETDIPLNCHGLWTVQFAVTALGHGGNTNGCSSMLLFDRKSGTCAVVMTNQQNENVYCGEMMELFFGSFEDSEYAGYNKELPEGFYRTARTITKGPLALYYVSMTKYEQSDLEGLWVSSKAGGIEKVTMAYGDSLRLSFNEIAGMLLSLLLAVLSVLYAAAQLAGSCVAVPARRIREKKSGIPTMRRPFEKWHLLACGLVLIFLVNTLLLIQNVAEMEPSRAYIWQFVLNAVIAVAMLCFVIMLAVRWKRLDGKKRTKVKYVFTAFFMLSCISIMTYWHMFEFWNI